LQKYRHVSFLVDDETHVRLKNLPEVREIVEKKIAIVQRGRQVAKENILKV